MLRRRDLRPRTVYSKNYSSSSSFTESAYNPQIAADTVTFGNYGWQNPPPYSDVGSIFSSSQTFFEMYPTESLTIYPAGGSTYPKRVGSFIPSVISSSLPALTTHNLSGYGAEAYRRMKPTAPKMDLLNSIFELKDIPSMLKQRFSPRMKSAADFHLATQFGWIPLWNDIKKFVEIQRNLQSILNQFLRDEGRPVRRSCTLLDETIISDPLIQSGSVYMQPSLGGSMYDGLHQRKEWTEVTNRVWASAQFRYWLPAGPRNIHWRKAMIRRIYGFRLTPSVVYNAVPWSWLVDWFLNVGDIIENTEGGIADRVAADYFYIMGLSQSSRYVTTSGKIRPRPGAPGNMVTCSARRSLVLKQRIKGNPFGVDASIDLSPMQLSILGALGLSRLS